MSDRFRHPTPLFSKSGLVLTHPLLDQLNSSIGGLGPGESVDVGGEWTTSSRQTYKSEAQIGSGSGPFVEVVDVRWRGALTSASPFSGIAFLRTAESLYWAKAPEISATLPVDVSLHAYAGYTAEGATFTASLGGAFLPGVPVAGSPDLARACTLGPNVLITGRVTCLARTSSADFLVLLIPRGLLKMGRKRLWRLREDVAPSLPPVARELLTHRRTGVVPNQPR